MRKCVRSKVPMIFYPRTLFHMGAGEGRGGGGGRFCLPQIVFFINSVGDALGRTIKFGDFS